MRGQTGAPLRRIQPELLAHRARQPGIGRGFRRPGSFVEAGKNDEVEIEQPRLQWSENGKARMQIEAGPHRARLSEFGKRIGIVAGRSKRDAVAVADQFGDKVRRRFACGPAPERSCAGVGVRSGERLGRRAMCAGEIAEGGLLCVHRIGEGFEQTGELGEPGLKCGRCVLFREPFGDASQPRFGAQAAQRGHLQRPYVAAEVAALFAARRQRVLEERKQRNGREPGRRGARDEREEGAGRRARQSHPGGIVDCDVPARHLGGDTAGKEAVLGDERGGAALGLQRFA